MIKTIVKKIPIVRDVARVILKSVAKYRRKNFKSSLYWENRYKSGGNSGRGSYSRLAEFKAEVVNDFVDSNGILTVMEFGCGDGAQLALANYPEYIGVDVSPTVLDQAKKKFSGDKTKRFLLADEAKRLNAELSISLDVVYHLIEDTVFEIYMNDLFQSAIKFVIVYSSNDEFKSEAPHVRHRTFTEWIESNAQEFSLIQRIKNRYPFDPADIDQTSFSDFFIFKRKIK